MINGQINTTALQNVAPFVVQEPMAPVSAVYSAEEAGQRVDFATLLGKIQLDGAKTEVDAALNEQMMISAETLGSNNEIHQPEQPDKSPLLKAEAENDGLETNGVNDQAISDITANIALAAYFQLARSVALNVQDIPRTESALTKVASDTLAVTPTSKHAPVMCPATVEMIQAQDSVAKEQTTPAMHQPEFAAVPMASEEPSIQTPVEVPLANAKKEPTTTVNSSNRVAAVINATSGSNAAERPALPLQNVTTNDPVGSFFEQPVGAQAVVQQATEVSTASAEMAMTPSVISSGTAPEKVANLTSDTRTADRSVSTLQNVMNSAPASSRIAERPFIEPAPTSSATVPVEQSSAPLAPALESPQKRTVSVAPEVHQTARTVMPAEIVIPVVSEEPSAQVVADVAPAPTEVEPTTRTRFLSGTEHEVVVTATTNTITVDRQVSPLQKVKTNTQTVTPEQQSVVHMATVPSAAVPTEQTTPVVSQQSAMPVEPDMRRAVRTVAPEIVVAPVISKMPSEQATVEKHSAPTETKSTPVTVAKVESAARDTLAPEISTTERPVAPLQKVTIITAASTPEQSVDVGVPSQPVVIPVEQPVAATAPPINQQPAVAVTPERSQNARTVESTVSLAAVVSEVPSAQPATEVSVSAQQSEPTPDVITGNAPETIVTVSENKNITASQSVPLQNVTTNIAVGSVASPQSTAEHTVPVPFEQKTAPMAQSQAVTHHQSVTVPSETQQIVRSVVPEMSTPSIAAVVVTDTDTTSAPVVISKPATEVITTVEQHSSITDSQTAVLQKVTPATATSSTSVQATPVVLQPVVAAPVASLVELQLAQPQPVVLRTQFQANTRQNLLARQQFATVPAAEMLRGDEPVTGELQSAEALLLPTAPAADSADFSNGEQQYEGEQKTAKETVELSNMHVLTDGKRQNTAITSIGNTVEESGKQTSHDQVVQQVKEHLVAHGVKQGSQQITLTLSPDSVGEIKMNLNLQGQKLSVEIITENRTVRDAILQHTDSLKESLARQNISMESFDVTTGGKGSGGQGQNHNAWRELARQQQHQQFWTSSRNYAAVQADAATAPSAYLRKTGNSMLDIHY